jgi:hypothetical protein
VRDQVSRARKRLDLGRAVTVTAPVAGVGAFALLKWAGGGSDKDPRAAGGGAELAVWQLLIAAQVVVWSLAAGIGRKAAKELEAHIRSWWPDSASVLRARWRRGVVGFVIFTYAAVALPLVVGGIAGLRNPYLMAGQVWKIPLLHVVAGVAAMPFLGLLKRIELCAADGVEWSTTRMHIGRIRLLRRYLRLATASLGGIIALAVIATGALRHAVEAASLEPLPESFMIVYGAWFTGVVAAIYLYASTALDERARWIMEEAAPLPDPKLEAAEAFTASTKLRAELGAELELGGDPRKKLEGLLVILSPLGGALLTRVGGL